MHLFLSIYYLTVVNLLTVCKGSKGMNKKNTVALLATVTCAMLSGLVIAYAFNNLSILGLIIGLLLLMKGEYYLRQFIRGIRFG